MSLDDQFPKYPFPGGWHLIPDYMRGGVYRFVMAGVRPGDFLSAVLEDKPFSQVAAYADDVNTVMLGGWAVFMHNFVPVLARRQGFESWIVKGGILGQQGEEK